ncbi:1-acyl-sn-glycerol-3-phosphate acyltransferase 2 [Senna tora]|uniref:1-acylglycerol-3-phosphate O-acyltransferase n=1 Tax=Senna tora TaxID=362788 RepID=A0A834SID0_9FABA|nr:1-acyl-sn-glycerol-3-phosphate acyltransferase 2 [Senna tora]
MAIVAAAVIVPLGLLFFASGLVINLIQASCYVLVRPLSKNLYRRINRVVAELLWLELVWIIDWWAGVKYVLSLANFGPDQHFLHFMTSDFVQVFTDSETFRMMGKEHALVICNHRSDIDWLVGWVLAQRSGCLGSTLAVMKKSSKYLPSGLQRLRDSPLPFWLALFVEGTRFTQAKLLAAQEYATSTGLPVPRNVLIPRTKVRSNIVLSIVITLPTSCFPFHRLEFMSPESGLTGSVNHKLDHIVSFVCIAQSVSHMRSFVPAIYDVTVAIPKSSAAPTMLRLFKGQPSVVHVHIKRHLMKELPETDEAVAQWCRDIFVAKDALLDKHIAEDTFSDQQLQNTGRPIKSLLVVVSWICLLVAGAVKFLQWSSILSSWKGVAFSAFGLLVVTILMHILIKFSQSERSTPARVTPVKPKNRGEQQDEKNQNQNQRMESLTSPQMKIAKKPMIKRRVRKQRRMKKDDNNIHKVGAFSHSDSSEPSPREYCIADLQIPGDIPDIQSLVLEFDTQNELFDNFFGDAT